MLEGTHSDLTSEKASTHHWSATSFIKFPAYATTMDESGYILLLPLPVGGELPSDQVGLSSLGEVVDNPGSIPIS